MIHLLIATAPVGHLGSGQHPKFWHSNPEPQFELTLQTLIATPPLLHGGSGQQRPKYISFLLYRVAQKSSILQGLGLGLGLSLGSIGFVKIIVKN
jgi:hypothetical protein